MPRAYVRLPHFHSGRSQSFVSGLRKVGFEVFERPFSSAGSNDVLVIWNRMGRDEHMAQLFQACGCKIIVAENGYISSPNERKMLALSRTYHNGAGQWPRGGPERWQAMNIPLAPWRARGDHILILPQRGLGSPGVAMPNGWENRTITKLRRMTDRRVVLRPHPGNKTGIQEPDFSNVWAAVVWGSGAGIKALAAGVPVFYDFPHWIGKDAGLPLLNADLESPFLGDRLPMFERLAWAQWTEREIETGEAFRELIAL